ncbi:hypothetical protein L596_002632 [Steinernema carpocapsae]|uniref:Uncharacterized protein n=1 Tax=Steinernema carpocapsae TaxID=34508 RepID=A0A4U8URN8_STECR|nr:hypothetical protein L596_002632 [Steinernema carpocapsae]
MTSVRTGDSLELEDFELIEEFLVDECAPTTSTNGGASEQQVTVRDSDLEQSSNASGVDHYESQTPNIVYEDNGVLYKDDKGNFYRVVSQRPSYSETPRINDALRLFRLTRSEILVAARSESAKGVLFASRREPIAFQGGGGARKTETEMRGMQNGLHNEGWVAQPQLFDTSRIRF